MSGRRGRRRFDKRVGQHQVRLISGTARSLAIAAVAVGWFGTLPAVAAQADDGLDGDTYTSEAHGWSVEFDDRVWEAEEAESDRGATLEYRGVSLSTDDAFANLLVYDDGIEDAGECLDDLHRSYSRGDGWDDLAPARRLDPPETAPVAEAELYAGTLLLDDGDVEAVLYLECREVQDATLAVTVTADEERYEDLLPDLEELLAGIDTGGSSPSRDDEDETPTADDEPATRDLGETDLDAGVFVGEAFPFRVEWDTDVWEKPEDISETNREGVALYVPGVADAEIFTQDTSPDYGVDECLDDNVDGWEEQAPGIESFTPEDGEEIAWPRGTEVAQATGGLVLADGSTVDLVFSAGCLELGDGEDYLILSFAVLESEYGATVAAFNDVLDSLVLVTGDEDDSPTPRDDETPTADDDDDTSDPGEIDRAARVAGRGVSRALLAPVVALRGALTTARG